MKHKILAIVALATGLSLSIVCGYFSIIGLTTLFPGAFWEVVTMGITLEVGKLVTISWLYHNYYSSPRILVAYLSVAVVTLMMITSMGVFGFLSKSHIEQQLQLSTGTIDEISKIKDKITIAEEEKKDIQKELDRIDKLKDKTIEKDKTTNAIKNDSNTDPKKKEWTEKKKAKNEEIGNLKAELTPLETKYRQMEAEVGPIKYVAELIWNDKPDAATLDKAVRFVILILIFVFDPLAVGLLIAFNISTQRITDQLEMEFLDMNRKLSARKRKGGN